MDEEQKVQEEEISSEQQEAEESIETSSENDQTAEELAKAKSYAENQRIRADRLEQEMKKLKREQRASGDERESYSLSDIRALNDVHDDDVKWLTDYAKFKGIPVAEAKKLPETHIYLKTRNEERTTAEVASTSSQKRGARASQTDYLSKIHSNSLENEDEMKAAAKAYVESFKKGK